MMAASDNGERAEREIKNHILFEIATEVAHRGMSDTAMSFAIFPVV